MSFLSFLVVQYEIVRIECDLEAASPQGDGWLVGDIDHEGVLLFREDGNYVSHRLVFAPNSVTSTRV